MKKRCIFVLIIIIVSFSITACFLDKNNDARKLLEIEKIPEKVIEQTKEEESYIIEKYPITQEDLVETIKIIMEDDIWFHVDNSNFYPYINKDIEFECYYNEARDCIFILPHIDPGKSGIYFVMQIGILDGRLSKSCKYVASTNLDVARAAYMSEVMSRGTVSIGVRRRPQYDASEEEIAYAVKNVQKEVENNRIVGGGSEIENVYIRNFYKGSEETLRLYTYEGTLYGSYISVESGLSIGWEDYGMEDQEYVKRLMECSIAVEKEKPLDKKTENELEAMIRQKMDQSIKTIIDDDIWFKNEKSLFYPYRNKEISYQYYYKYYYNRKDGFVDVFPIIESEGQTVFCIISFVIRNDKLKEGNFYDDKERAFYDKERASYELENIQGSGTVRIGDRRKPAYDADEDEVETVKENVRKYMEYCRENHFDFGKEFEDIYIRNFYQGAADTKMIYTCKGKRYYTYIDTNGEYHSGENEIEESEKEYDRIMECSFPLYDE